MKKPNNREVAMAHNSANAMQKRVASGESANLKDAEILEDRENLNEARKYLKEAYRITTIENRSAISSLNNVLHYLEKAGRLPLEKKIRFEAVPKAVIISAEIAMAILGDDASVTADSVENSLSEVGHGVRKIMDLIRRNAASVFFLAVLKFIADTALIAGDLETAEYEYQWLDSRKGIEATRKLREAHPHLPTPGFLSIARGQDPLERAHEIRKAYEKFIGIIKNTPEYRVDLEQVLHEVSEEVEREFKRTLTDEIKHKA